MSDTIEVGRCSECDSTEVDELRWINVNTDDTTGSGGDGHNNEWCNNCGEYTEIKYANEPIPK